MFRGNRGKRRPAIEYVFPILGLVLAILLAWGVGFVTGQDGSNYAREDRYQPYRYAADNEQNAQAALTDQAKPVEYRRPCRDPKGNSESELCAQWKAARAAETGALWTERAFWVGIIGAIGIIAALLLTVDSNSIARDTARRQLRAYVSVDLGKIVCLPHPNGTAIFELPVEMRNGGVTPAYRTGLFGSIIPLTMDLAKEFLLGLSESDKGEAVLTTIHNGAAAPTAIKASDPAVPANVVRLLMEGPLLLFAYGEVSYEDTFGVRQKTRFCYYLPADDLRSVMSGYDRHVRWHQTAFFNEAT